MSTRRRRPEPPPLEIKQFTPNEIDLGIVKLRRRIEEIRALETSGTRYNDQRKYTAEENIRITILEMFGPNSPQYRDHQYHEIWQGGHQIPMGEVYPGDPEDVQRQTQFLAAIPQTIKMLEGLAAWLEEKRSELGHDTTTRIRAAFEGLDLHPRISSVCADLYRNGHYRNAVLDASVTLVNFVKERSGRHDLDGANLMRVVFSKNTPILAFNELRDQTDQDQQEGMMHLFEGAVLALRNPRAHALLDDSPEDALEYIALLSLLAKHLERAKRR